MVALPIPHVPYKFDHLLSLQGICLHLYWKIFRNLSQARLIYGCFHKNCSSDIQSFDYERVLLVNMVLILDGNSEIGAGLTV